MIFPLHFLSLLGLCFYAAGVAAVRSKRAPFVLVVLYTAFFLFCNFVLHVTQTYDLDYTSVFAAEAFAAYRLNVYAAGMERSSFVDGFCLLQICSIINQLLMFLSYVNLYEGLLYAAILELYETAALVFSVLALILMVGIIGGNNARRHPDYGRQQPFSLVYLSYRFFSAQAIQANGWQEGQTISVTRQKRRR